MQAVDKAAKKCESVLYFTKGQEITKIQLEFLEKKWRILILINSTFDQALSIIIRITL